MARTAAPSAETEPHRYPEADLALQSEADTNKVMNRVAEFAHYGPHGAEWGDGRRRWVERIDYDPLFRRLEMLVDRPAPAVALFSAPTISPSSSAFAESRAS